MWAIYDFWDWVATFINQLTWTEFISVFWYFIFLEVPRYIILNGVILFMNAVYPRYSNKHIAACRSRLFKEMPLVSVIAPGKNEGKNIYTLIRSLDYQTYKNFELIVVDDGSDDNTEEYCKSFVKSHKIKHFLRNEIRGGKASAANFAVNFCKGKYIVHIDADSSLDPSAIEESILPFYLDPKIGAVGGNIFVRNYDTNLATICQCCEYLQTIMLSRIVTSRINLYRIVSGAFGAFRTDILKQIGNWDIGPGLDGDITQKIRKLHYNIYFADKAICRTNVPESWWTLTRQRLRWNKSLIRFRIFKHGDVFTPNENFSLMNMLSSFDNIFFNIVASFLWVIYVVQLALYRPQALLFAFLIKLVLYSLVEVIKLLFVSKLIDHNKYIMRLIISVIPLMSLYMGVYMRIVRIISYIQEAYGYSYKDPWNPKKTSDEAKKFGL